MKKSAAALRLLSTVLGSWASAARPAALSVSLLLSATSAVSAEWSVSEAGASIEGVAGVLEARWLSKRPPEGRYDTIQLHRYRGEGPPLAALLYLPGTNMNGQIAVSEENHNLWLFLARRGVEVYTLDYRTHRVPVAALEDASFMEAWTMQAFVADAATAVELIRRNSSDLPLFIAGFSRGVWLGYGLVATQEPGSLAGFVALDGAFKSYRTREQYDYEAALAAFVERGNWASDVAAGIGWQARDSLMKAASHDPEGPALAEGFATVGEQVATILQNAWRPGGLANPLGGMSRVRILARLLEGYDRYYPAIQNVESAAIADFDDNPALRLDDRWGELDLPILYFGATNMGADWLLDGIYSASKSGSKDVTIHVLEEYGHLDVLVGERAREDVFEPLLEWIRAHSERI